MAGYTLLIRLFVGLVVDDRAWERTVFYASRDRLLEQTLLRDFFRLVLALANWAGLTSYEHFSVDGTMIEACASHKSIVPKDGSDNQDSGSTGDSRNAGVNFKGEMHSNATHASKTDPCARL